MRINHVPIGEIANFINGFAFKPSDWTDNGFKIIRIQNLTNKSKPYNRTNKDVKEKYIVKKGDILVSWSATIDIFEWTDDEAYLNQHIFKVEFDDTLITKEYFKHALKQTIEKLSKLAHGATMKHVTKKAFDKHKIPLPENLDDQIRIANLLSQVELLIAKREESIKLLDELLKSTFLDMFGDPVLNPKGWDITTLSDLGVTLKGGKSIAECKDNSIPENRILKISAITDGTFKPEESKPLPDEYKVPASHYVKKGDLLMSRANTSELVGATAYVWNTHLNLVLPDKIWRFLLPNKVPLNQMFYWKLSQTKAIRTKISKRATGTGGSMKNISMPKVLSIPIILPPVKIQDKFAAIVQQSEQTKEQHQKSLQELQNLFGSLSQRAFRGELF